MRFAHRPPVGIASLVAACALALASPAAATTLLEFEGDSFHGGSGELAITDNGDGSFGVVQTIYLSDFDDRAAVNTNRTQLQTLGWKLPFENISSVELAPGSMDLGTLAWPSNVNNGGCKSSSPAGFVCVTLDPVDAVNTESFSIAYVVKASGFDEEAEASFRGSFGPRNGWVISDEGGTPVPEPSAAAVFAVGLLVVGGRLRRPTA